MSGRKNTAWLKAVAECSTECQHCQARFSTQVHHLKGVGHWSGTSLKAPDWLTVPLCAACHDLVHEQPHIQPASFRRTWARLVRHGYVTIAYKDARGSHWSPVAVQIYKEGPWDDEAVALKLMRFWDGMLEDPRSLKWARFAATCEHELTDLLIGWNALCEAKVIIPVR